MRSVLLALKTCASALRQEPLALLGLLMLIDLPPVLLGQALGLKMQGQLIAQLAWTPGQVFFGALALQRLARGSGLAFVPAPAWRAALRWVFSDLLLSARLAPRALLGVLPGIFVTAWLDPHDLATGLFCTALILLGLFPALIWLYFRCLSPCLAVLQGLGPAQSLDQAPGMLAGRHGRAFWLMGLLGSASLLLGHAPDLLPEGGLATALSCLCLPLASLLELGWMLELFRER